MKMRNPRDKRTVLIFRIGSMGDSVVALPVLHAIRRKFPQEQIVLLTNTPVDGGKRAVASHQIYEGCGVVDEYLSYPHAGASWRELFAMLVKLRRLKISSAFYVMPLRTITQRLRDRLFLALVGVVRVKGLSWWRRAPPLYNTSTSLYESEAQMLLREAGFATLKLAISDFDMRLGSDADPNYAGHTRATPPAGPRVALCMGGKAEVGQWGKAKWEALISKIYLTMPNAYIFFIGSASERAAYEALRIGDSEHSPINLCGDLSPRQTAKFLTSVDILITHDTGPMHLASAVGTACVSIFSGREMPGIWFPFAQEQNVLYTKLPCNGCKLSVCIERGAECVQLITVDQVMKNVIHILDQQHEMLCD